MVLQSVQRKERENHDILHYKFVPTAAIACSKGHRQNRPFLRLQLYQYVHDMQLNQGKTHHSLSQALATAKNIPD